MVELLLLLSAVVADLPPPIMRKLAMNSIVPRRLVLDLGMRRAGALGRSDTIGGTTQKSIMSSDDVLLLEEAFMLLL
jgi:hypothetical protein